MASVAFAIAPGLSAPRLMVRSLASFCILHLRCCSSTSQPTARTASLANVGDESTIRRWPSLATTQGAAPVLGYEARHPAGTPFEMPPWHSLGTLRPDDRPSSRRRGRPEHQWPNALDANGSADCREPRGRGPS